MAKIAQLKQNGVVVYPQSITAAVADATKGKLLSQIITELETEALGWTIEPTTQDSNLSYTLYKQVAQPDGTYTKVSASTFTIAQDIYLETVEYVATKPAGYDGDVEFPAMHFVFNTDSGKQDIYVSVKDLVDVYTADNEGITVSNNQFSLVLDPNAGNILTKSATGLLATIAAEGDTFVTANIDASAKNKVVVAAVTGTTEGGEAKLAVASDVKSYVDAAVDAEADRVDALTATESGATDYASVTVTTTGANVSAVAVTTNVATDISAVTSTDKKIADAYAMKSYVDAQVGAGNVKDSTDITAHASATGTTLDINFANSGATDSTEGVTNAVFNTTQALAINGKQVYTWAVTAEDKGNAPEFVWPTA